MRGDVACFYSVVFFDFDCFFICVLVSEPGSEAGVMDSKAGARSFRDRRRPVISKDRHKPNLGARVAESAGQSAAGCAAVFCCCPCSLASLLYLTAVKLPTRLVRHTLGRGVRFSKKGAGIQPKKDAFDEDAISVHAGWIPVAMWAEDAWPSKMASPELVALEKEMSAWFYGAGFWRSPSQKE